MNHIGMFMENNASLLALRRQEAMEEEYPYAEYSDGPHKGFGKVNTRRQASVKIRNERKKKTPNANQLNQSFGAPQSVQEYREPGQKKMKRKRPASPKQQPPFNNSTTIAEA